MGSVRYIREEDVGKQIQDTKVNARVHIWVKGEAMSP